MSRPTREQVESALCAADESNPTTGGQAALAAEVRALRAERQAVLDLHVRKESGSRTICGHCIDGHEELYDYPCPTTRALGVTS